MTVPEAARRAGISYRQIDYWIRCGHIFGADRLKSIGSGYYRDMTHDEVAFTRVLARLVRAGIRVDVAAAALRQQVAKGVDVRHIRSLQLDNGVGLSLTANDIPAQQALPA